MREEIRLAGAHGRAPIRARMIANRRGAALALVAVSLVVILGMGALAVDMGMLIKQHNDAQRAADAAALAGASAFQDAKPFDAIVPAGKQAIEYLAKNYVGGTYIDTSGAVSWVNGGNRYVTQVAEGMVVVLPDSQKVRVIVRRAAVGTFFARVLGFFSVPIAAKAAARVFEAGSGKCVKPFAFPDYWSDADNDNDPANRLEDLGPGQGKGGETWEYGSSPGDHYRAYGNDDGTGDVTGLGSSYRNNSVAGGDKTNTKYWDDKGRPIILKKSNPQQTSSPGFFLPWVLPGSNPGAADYKANIIGCNPAQINLTTDFNVDGSADTSSYDNKPGNMIGPTKQGMDSLIALDPKACWAPSADPDHAGYTTGKVMLMSDAGTCTVDYPGWMSSPRVAIVPLFDPAQMQSGKTQLRFNNLALIFLDPQLNRQAPVAGHFLYFVRGTGPADPNTGSLVKQLKLVE